MLVRIAQHLGWRMTLLLLLANFLLQGLILGVSYPACCAALPPLDVSVLLNHASVYGFFAAIGAEGRTWYFINEISLDMLFPLAYGAAYFALLARLLCLNDLLFTRAWLLLWLPLGIALADVCENLHIAVLLAYYPQSFNVTSLSVANFIKHSLSLLTALSLLGLALRLLWLKFRVARHSPAADA